MHPLANQMADEIVVLAQRALKTGVKGQAASEARTRSLRPLVYMRFAEVEAVLRDLDLKPGMRVVDFSSPQWLSLTLASRHAKIDFLYTNIIDAELTQYEEIAKALNLRNIRFERADLRDLKFPDNHFDRALSVSVIEHVYPEVGGDVAALREIQRVLKPEGKLLLTVPCKAKRNVVHVSGAVYEREAQKNSFYAREYDQAQFGALLSETGFRNTGTWFIGERPGWLALDDMQWGARRGTGSAKATLFLRGAVERLLSRSFDSLLASRHLSVSAQPADRLVNLAACLGKG